MAADKMNLQYVILPDGTISYDLAKIYNQLREARKSMTEEDWKEIETLLNDSKDKSKKEAVMKILEKAGIKFEYDKDQNSLSVRLGDRTYYIGFVNFADKRIWGAVQSGKSTYSIDLSNEIEYAGDLFLTLGHELIHAVMEGRERNIVKSIEKQYGTELKEVFMELTSYQWQFSVLNQVPHISDEIKETIIVQHRTFYIWWYDPR
jgi:hypothetical protein